MKGAAATVDRPFLGWQGKFFLHHISHDHVVVSLNLQHIAVSLLTFIRASSITSSQIFLSVRMQS